MKAMHLALLASLSMILRLATTSASASVDLSIPAATFQAFKQQDRDLAACTAIDTNSAPSPQNIVMANPSRNSLVRSLEPQDTESQADNAVVPPNAEKAKRTGA
jgi:hypothetical protein